MISLLKNNLLDSLKTVAPLVIVAGLLQITLAQAPALLFVQFLAGVALVVLGMTLLFIGIDLGVLPMGRFIGAELPKQGSIAFILVVAFVMGFATTIAEPRNLPIGDRPRMSGPISASMLTTPDNRIVASTANARDGRMEPGSGMPRPARAGWRPHSRCSTTHPSRGRNR